MSLEQRNSDFCKAQTDAQMAYIEAEREVDRLQTENAKLRKLCGIIYGRLQSAEEVTEMGLVDARLTRRMHELGIEVDA